MRNNPNYHSLIKWMNSFWYIHTVDYYKAIKINELQLHAITWMSPPRRESFCPMARKLLLNLNLLWCSINAFSLVLFSVAVKYYEGLCEDWWSPILSLLYSRIFLHCFLKDLAFELSCLLWLLQDFWVHDYGEITSKLPCVTLLLYMPTRFFFFFSFFLNKATCLIL